MSTTVFIAKDALKWAMKLKLGFWSSVQHLSDFPHRESRHWIEISTFFVTYLRKIMGFPQYYEGPFPFLNCNVLQTHLTFIYYANVWRGKFNNRIFLQLTIDIMYWGKNQLHYTLLKPKKKNRKKNNSSFSICILVSSQDIPKPLFYLSVIRLSVPKRFQIENIIHARCQNWCESWVEQRQKKMYYCEFIPVLYYRFAIKYLFFILWWNEIFMLGNNKMWNETYFMFHLFSDDKCKQLTQTWILRT